MLWMSRYFDPANNCVLYGDTVLPIKAFRTPETLEINLVNDCFEFAKFIAEVDLDDSAFGLYAALVLLQTGKIVQVLMYVGELG